MEHAKNMNRNRDDLMALPRPRSSGGSFRSFMASTTDDRRWGSFPCWRRDDEEEEEEEGGVDADPVEAGSGSAQENDQSGRSPSRRDGRSAVRIRPRSGGAATAPTIGRCAVDAPREADHVAVFWRRSAIESVRVPRDGPRSAHQRPGLYVDEEMTRRPSRWKNEDTVIDLSILFF